MCYLLVLEFGDDMEGCQTVTSGLSQESLPKDNLLGGQSGTVQLITT